MFLEPTQSAHLGSPGTGWIEVICGSMFSGKTEELLRRLRRAQFAKQRVGIFKHSFDTRFDAEAIVSHDRNTLRSIPVGRSEEILVLADHFEVIGIDEAQFFDEGIVSVVSQLADSGKRVILAGLDMDYLGNPFGPMPPLLAIAEYVTKLHAICTRTGEMAHFSHRKDKLEGQLMLGEKEQYEPLSRRAFLEAQRSRKPGPSDPNQPH